MKQVTIEDTERYKVVSHGNGLAYECTDKISGKSVLFQGDDALEWKKSYEYMQAARVDPASGWSKNKWDYCLRELTEQPAQKESQ